VIVSANTEHLPAVAWAAIDVNRAVEARTVAKKAVLKALESWIDSGERYDFRERTEPEIDTASDAYQATQKALSQARGKLRAAIRKALAK
jgi:hypothetical protein